MAVAVLGAELRTYQLLAAWLRTGHRLEARSPGDLVDSRTVEYQAVQYQQRHC